MSTQTAPQGAAPPLDARIGRSYGTNGGPAGKDSTVASSLGWLSIGLGLAEIAAPRALSRFLGLDDHRHLIRALGLREIASGVGILSSLPRPAGWVWSRVAGDALDIGLLLAALGHTSKPGRVLGALAAVGGVTALDTMTGDRLTRRSISDAGPATGTSSVDVIESIAVTPDRSEAYAFWRRLENLPIVMEHLESVTQLGGERSRWVAKGPAGKRVEWEAEITRDVPGEEIAWTSVEGSDVVTAGCVRFTPDPAGRGTLVELQMSYSPPLGVVGALAAKMLGEDPEAQIREGLRRFKRMLETGEIPTTEGQPSGRKREHLAARQRHAEQHGRAHGASHGAGI